MKLSFLSIAVLFTNCYAFKLPTTPQVVKMNDNIYNQYDHLGKYKQWFEPNLFSTIHDYHSHDIKHDVVDFSHKAGNEVVKIISLPCFANSLITLVASGPSGTFSTTDILTFSPKCFSTICFPSSCA